MNANDPGRQNWTRNAHGHLVLEDPAPIGGSKEGDMITKDPGREGWTVTPRTDIVYVPPIVGGGGGAAGTGALDPNPVIQGGAGTISPISGGGLIDPLTYTPITFPQPRREKRAMLPMACLDLMIKYAVTRKPFRLVGDLPGDAALVRWYLDAKYDSVVLVFECEQFEEVDPGAEIPLLPPMLIQEIPG
jgi:hypothetical protein